jgi:hypothetical protein
MAIVVNENIEHDTVLVNEEYGYRYWIWFPQMKYQEIIKFWESMEHCTVMHPKDDLPGYLVQINKKTANQMREEVPTAPYAFWHDDNDSFLAIMNKTYYHRGAIHD